MEFTKEQLIQFATERKELAAQFMALPHSPEAARKDFAILEIALAALSDKLIQGWIPCSERMPEMHERVLISDFICGERYDRWDEDEPDFMRETLLARLVPNKYPEVYPVLCGDEIIWDCEGGEALRTSWVTHWMPIVTPEGGKDG